MGRNGRFMRNEGKSLTDLTRTNHQSLLEIPLKRSETCRMDGLLSVMHSGASIRAECRLQKEKAMQFALLIYESPELFATRKNDDNDPYRGAWRVYYKALVDAGIYVGGDALEVPETGTTVQITEGNRRVQDGPYADTKEQLAGLLILELPSLDAALDWAARCPGASGGAVEVRPLAPSTKLRITG
jgi:hypothetical protein